MLNLLCSLGLASCVTVANGNGYQTQLTPDGYILTHNLGVTFYTTTPPGPFVATHVTVVRARHGNTVDVIYPPGTAFYAPNLANKTSD
jgi:hypothetical protein